MSKLKIETPLGCLGLVVYGCAMFVIGVLLNGWVLSKLWAWFIVPPFAAPPLTLVQAIGVSVVAAFLIRSAHKDSGSKDSDESFEHALAKSAMTIILSPLMALAFGWILLQFI